jgi:hypothetical protein
MNFQLPYFGDINAAALEVYYQSEIELNGQDVTIDLTFEKKTTDEHTIEKLISFLNDIVAFEAQNSILIKSDFDNDGDAADYIKVFSKKLPDASALQLLDKLKLMQISLFPDSDGTFAQFDYYIPLTELHSQLLTVRLNQLGEPEHIAWES